MSLPDPNTEAPASQPAPGGASGRRRKKQVPFWIEFPLLIGAALVIAVLIKTFLFQAFWIPSESMKDTLQVFDRVLVSKVTYEFSDIERGDVIVFDDPRPGFRPSEENAIERALRNLKESVGLATPQSEFIKRVIGLPGDVVEGSDGGVFVNGERLTEPYLKNPTMAISSFGPVEVPDGFLFVMGDNRSASQDSRFFGAIPVDDVVGKAFVIIWPMDRFGQL